MRKVIAIEFISLDGVIQSPGRPEEDGGGGFSYGGWIAPYSDPILGAAIKKEMSMPFDLLLGRTTFENIPDNLGWRKTLVCRRQHSSGIQGGGEHGQLEGRNCRQLRTGWGDHDR
ncbi:MAG TPA: hypothetical protein VMV83_14750 [Rectinemataceae bacterium]|nr:hypothetical protein [Rectinemataceae bacterium]